MRVLTLAGHYKRPITIDICEACSLIWFDGTESIKLAGPGIADLIQTIHAALGNSTVSTLASPLPCPSCASPLDKVFNLSRFGRTQQWQCPQGHGYFQTFVLYLAEKGFVRKMGWADIKQLIGSKRQLFCAGCGAVLDDKPHDACPYCRSIAGVIDPARLASAIDIQQAAAPPDLPTAVVQSKCWSCGGVVNPTQESHCSHCRAIVKKIDSQRAVDASTAVEEKVRQNYHQQLPAVSSKKLQDVAAQQAWMSAVVNRMDDRHIVTREQVLKWTIVVVPLVLLLVWLLVQWQTRVPTTAAPPTTLTPSPRSAKPVTPPSNAQRMPKPTAQ